MPCALLVEDDPTSRAFLQGALEMLGWQVEAHADGASAVAAAIAQRFDVMLLDLNLPDMDGGQVLRQIRNRDDHASVDSPALLATADPDPAVHQRLRRQGFDAIVTKPLSLQQLSQALASLGFARGAVMEPPPAARTASTSPIWDDASALALAGGRRENLAALRTLLLADLRQQCDSILADPDGEQARGIRHRLRAACNFCGTPRLAQALTLFDEHSSAQSMTEACTELAAAVVELLATPPP